MEKGEDNSEATFYHPDNETAENYDNLQSSDAASDYGVQPANTSDGMKWTASEYIAHQKTAGWFIALGAGSAVLGLIVFLATKSIFSALTIILVCLCIAVMGARKPQNIEYSLDERGVGVGEKGYPYSQFKSFSVVEEGAISCIWLRSLKRYQPTVAMYFAPEDEGRIIDYLSSFLPHEEREPDAFDRLSHRFRF
ncbi:MAG: hypothetical protein M3Q79_04095 [bacterium]|nr:hypothetical protein [bacterium]